MAWLPYCVDKYFDINHKINRPILYIVQYTLKWNPIDWKRGKYDSVIKLYYLISRIKFQSWYTHEFRKRCAGLFLAYVKDSPFLFHPNYEKPHSLLLLDLSFLICSSLFSIHTYSVYWLRISGSISLFCIHTCFVSNFI